MNFVALHGFLGTVGDWKGWDAYPVALKPSESFQTFAREFNAWAKEYLKPPRGILGYSLGGRLALHVLLDDPTLWSGGILISTHPGLDSDEERQQRLMRDKVWAERFLRDPWELLMKDWEGQPIFKEETSRFLRKEGDYQREDLAKWLTSFSLGVQENLRRSIEKLPVPLTWMTGEHDQAFTALAKSVCEHHALSKHVVVPGGHHRCILSRSAIEIFLAF